MAKKRDLCRAASGAFVRNLGRKVTPGGYAQHKFHLGREETKATVANLRLELLWQEVCKRWERENDYALHPTDQPVWDDVTLAVAEAVRTGEPVAKIDLPLPFSAMVPESPLTGAWLDRLQRDVTIVKIELRDPAAAAKTDEHFKKEGTRLVDMGRRLLNKKAGGETLHAALTAYAAWIPTKFMDAEKRVSFWGTTQMRQVNFLREKLPDGPLAGLDADRVDELLDILRLRPAGANGRPVSVAWAQNIVKQFRAFLRWLNRSPQFTWKRPADLEVGQIRIPLLPGERGRAALASRVATYAPDELRTLWQYASPFQRLLMLLTLNCGFGKAEVSSLEMDEVLLRRPHPRGREVGHPGTDADSWALRVRHKSGVYGEWKLWPETARAVDWWLARRAALRVPDNVTTLLVTASGRRFTEPTAGNHPNYQIPNAWLDLGRRVRRDHPTFRRLSFNKLRKTAGNMVREQAGGEVAGVFLCHGTPVRADVQLDLYTNRPFAKVFAATDAVGDQLRPVWTSVADPFPPPPPPKPKPPYAKGKLGRIQKMRRQGYKTAYIAKKLGVTTTEVRRCPQPNFDPPQT